MADQTFAVHCGFFDAINSDRTYSADEMNRPYKRVISNGVFATPNGTPSTDLQVTASSGMNIICKKGEGLFGDKWFENPSGIAITVPSNTGTVPRIDSVIVQVDTRTSGRVGNIVHRTGTPASSPVPPAINQTEGVIEYRLANIRVNAGVSAITQSMITDRRGSSDCPWVTSLIYQVDTSTLYDQWQAAYAEYFEEEKAIWDAWYAQLTEDLDVSMTLDRHVNTVTTTAQTTGYIPIGLEYNHNTDILEVYINGLRAVEGTHYVVVDDTTILVENQLQIGQEVTFVVMRSVISGSATNIMVLLQELESQIAGIAGGTPTVVDAKADMTEHDKIYILSTDGKWYYYSATAEDWVIGGTYGGVPTDTTLTQEGMAADAKAVGDALADKADADDLTALGTRVTDVEGALEDKADADDVEVIDENVSDLQSDLNTVTSELFTVSDNLFDFDSIIENAVPDAIGSSADATVTLNGWKTSNYIPVEAGQQYALILNGAITTGAIFRVACYSNGIMTYKTSGGTEPNPFTIPSGVDHVRFFSNTASLFAARTATSFKKYSADMSLAWTPYGDSPKFASKDAVQEYGVYVDGTNYYHFVRFGEQTLIRLFKQEGPNNLFQFSALYTGNVTKDGVNIGQTIATNGTDTVGPISIMRQGVDSGGMWTGGWHTRTVNGVACPTAEQESLDIKINGESIVGADGLHYGECVATVVNKLYFAQTITGSDLSTATQAIQETVTYILNEKMTARVIHKYVADTRVILYYGMQAVRIGFNNILLPNNETAFAFADMTANINLDKPEDLMQMSNNDWNYDLIMKPFGLAKYTHNSGAGSTKYGYLPTATRKVYWALMEGTYDYTFITSGKVLAWEGVWDIYPN